MNTIYHQYLQDASAWLHERAQSEVRHPLLIVSEAYGGHAIMARALTERLAGGIDGGAISTHPDVISIGDTPEYRVRIDVDTIRDILQRSVLSTVHGSRRVVCILNAERLTISATNALLKAVEEHSGGVAWIFSTSAVDTIPDTLRSRCEEYTAPAWKPTEELWSNIPYLELWGATQESTEMHDVVQAMHAWWTRWYTGTADRKTLKIVLEDLEGASESMVPWNIHIDWGIAYGKHLLLHDGSQQQVRAAQLDFLQNIRHTMRHTVNTTLIFELLICNMHIQQKD